MNLAAIQTNYAGHRFRSRLEARYAVFFDTLNIAWEYEAQGYEVEDRLNFGTGTGRYLPDFWLPEHGIHAEVKGQMDAPKTILNNIASVADTEGGCSGSMLLLGPIPRPGTAVLPTLLHMHKGELLATPWLLIPTAYPHDVMEIVVADDGGTIQMMFPESLLDGMQIAWKPWVTAERLGIDPITAAMRVRSHADRGYTSARSARFEHGEVPAL